MKYKGIYWHILVPMIKKSKEKNYGKEIARRAIKSGRGGVPVSAGLLFP